jgi:hypothetical protein
MSFNKQNVVLACHITGVYDVNRNEVLNDDDYSIIKPWADSLIQHQINGIVFHNSLSDQTCKQYSNEFISFQKIEYDKRFNPNVFRYIVYNDFLNKHQHEIKSLFITDVSDVVMLKNPFEDLFFNHHPQHIFCGDEPKLLANDWMQKHCTHLRKNVLNFEEFEKKYSQSILLNCGIIGGEISIMKSFIEKLSQLHRLYNVNNSTAYTGDMGGFNYIARTFFNDQIIHGKPVSTVFKAYENNRIDCWFKHK